MKYLHTSMDMYWDINSYKSFFTSNLYFVMYFLKLVAYVIKLYIQTLKAYSLPALWNTMQNIVSAY